MALRKANVLVVDDKRANLLGLEAVLGDLHNVIFANSGEESLDILGKRSDVDLILMDVQMPGMDGFETAQHIKQIPAARRSRSSSSPPSTPRTRLSGKATR